MEPVTEEIFGCFLDIQENMENDAEESHSKMSGKKKKPKENIEVQSRHQVYAQTCTSQRH